MPLPGQITGCAEHLSLVLAAYPGQVGIHPIPLNWGAPTAAERGPVVASRHVNSLKVRNAIGAYSGSYSIYRALAAACGLIDPSHRPGECFNLLASGVRGARAGWLGMCWGLGGADTRRVIPHLSPISCSAHLIAAKCTVPFEWRRGPHIVPGPRTP